MKEILINFFWADDETSCARSAPVPQTGSCWIVNDLDRDANSHILRVDY